MAQTRERIEKQTWNFHDAAVNAAVAALRAGKSRREQARAAAEALWALRGQQPPDGWATMDAEVNPDIKPVVHETVDQPTPAEEQNNMEDRPMLDADDDDVSPPVESDLSANPVLYRRWLIARGRQDGRGVDFDQLTDFEIEDVVVMAGRRMDFQPWLDVRFSA